MKIFFGILFILVSVNLMAQEIPALQCKETKGLFDNFAVTAQFSPPDGFMMAYSLIVTFKEKNSDKVLSEWITISDSPAFILIKPAVDAGEGKVVGEATVKANEGQPSGFGIKGTISEEKEAKLVGGKQFDLKCE